jgi:hypothetical protein
MIWALLLLGLIGYHRAERAIRDAHGKIHTTLGLPRAMDELSIIRAGHDRITALQHG